MKTLIELFDESPILNVLASIAFKPEKLIFFGADSLQVEESRSDYMRFFKSRGESPEIEYISADMENIDEVNDTLAKIISENPDCVVDVTGGKDIALLAAGMAAVKLGVPLIAYNRRTKKYANISKYEHAMRANIFGLLDCEDFFNVSGGKVIESEDFSEHRDDFGAFWSKVLDIWNIYLENIGSWVPHVQFLQRVSPACEPNGNMPLKVRAPENISVNGKQIFRNDDILRALDRCGGITELKYHENGECTFYYCDKKFSPLSDRCRRVSRAFYSPMRRHHGQIQQCTFARQI